MDDFANRDGKRVWLSQDEIDMAIETCSRPREELALRLMGNSGLRRGEVVDVTYDDVLQAPDGFVRVWHGKGNKYREAPISDELQAIVRSRAYDHDGSDRVCVVTSTDQVYRWVRKVSEQLADKTGDVGWGEVSPHDFRRSWGGILLWECGVMPHAVLEFGGWEDWETFREHYLGEMTPAAMERERHKAFSDPSPEIIGETFAAPGGAAEVYNV